MGGLSLDAAGRRIAGAANQPGRLALLAVIAQSGERGVSRDRLLALFWPERDTERARGALNQALYSLRRDIGEQDLVLGTSILRLNPEIIESDAMAFEQALDSGELEAAMRRYAGPFLDGIHLGSSDELERWLDERRDHLRRRYADAATLLAAEARARDDPAAEARWWRVLTAMDPLDGKAALGLVRALADSGDRTGALQHAAQHEATLRIELELPPDPELVALMAELRTPPAMAAAAEPTPERDHGRPEPSLATVVPASPLPQKTRRRGSLIVVVAVASLLFLAASVGRALLHGSELTPYGIHPVANASIIEFQPALSPDGKSVAYIEGPLVGPRRLMVRSTGSVTSGGEIHLGGDADETQWLPSWSPDGESVRYLGCQTPNLPIESPSCHWKETGRLGGAVRELPFPGTSSAAWSPDDSQVAYSDLDSLFIQSLGDGTRHLVAVQKTAPRGLHSITWSPDGKWLAFANGNPAWRQGENVDQASVWMVAASGGQTIRITSADVFSTAPAWFDGNHLLFVSDRDGARNIYLVEVGPNGPAGEPRPIPGATDVHSISYSTAGHRLAWTRFAPRHNIWAFPLTSRHPLSIRAGRHVTDGNQIIETHDVSRDNNWLAFESNRAGDMDIYKVPTSGGPPIRLTDAPGNEFRPRWSPDGSELVYYGGVSILHTFIIPSAGGPPAQLSDVPGSNPIWAPDGKQIVFKRSRISGTFVVSRDSAGAPWQTAVEVPNRPCPPEDWAAGAGGFLCPTALRLMVRTTSGQILWKRELAGPFDTRCPGPRYSRDGSTIYCLLDPGQRGIYAIPVAGGKPRLIVADDDENVHLTGDVSVDSTELFLTVSQADADVMVMTLGR